MQVCLCVSVNRNVRLGEVRRTCLMCVCVRESERIQREDVNGVWSSYLGHREL